MCNQWFTVSFSLLQDKTITVVLCLRRNFNVGFVFRSYGSSLPSNWYLFYTTFSFNCLVVKSSSLFCSSLLVILKKKQNLLIVMGYRKWLPPFGGDVMSHMTDCLVTSIHAVTIVVIKFSLFTEAKPKGCLL